MVVAPGTLVVAGRVVGGVVVAREGEVRGGEHPDRDEHEQQGADLATSTTASGPNLPRVARCGLGSRHRDLFAEPLGPLGPLVHHRQIVRRFFPPSLAPFPA